MVKKDFTRKITHTYKDYSKLTQKIDSKRGKLSSIVDKKIYSDDILKYKDGVVKKSKNNYVDNNFINYKHDKFGSLLIFGGIAFVFLLIMLRHARNNPLEGGYLFLTILFSSILIFFIIYYFTMPHKEQILNQRDGLITITGFFWAKNITMPFEDMLFSYSTGGDNMVGAFQLQAVRPKGGPDPFELAGDCYESMSFITWYMDKNRPLPPGSAFDEFRQQDYERRKAEGFPKPLYPSNIPTPEATKEQQKERKAIGGW
ncbi:hypothetical protein GCM10009117_25800 [Gangjinia marincola]|uniref:Uncharacterized protein n=1 Tax=Gangjinia marincola TaxID=578463 RepID=A0ABP3XVG8_9FLAO